LPNNLRIRTDSGQAGMTTFYAVIVIMFSLLVILCPVLSVAGDKGQTDESFSYTFNTLISGDAQDPAHSTQNPDNAFLGLYRYSTDLQVRPDFFLERPEVSALFKPRFTASHQWFQDGAAHGMTDSPNRAFVNEWRVQAKPFSTLFLSFGKEKLLWGPSFLASPSNILFKDIEKLNPKAEVEGKYLAKAIYVPNTMVTVNMIAETQKEETALQETQKPMQVVKADVLGSNYLVSVIGYHQQNVRSRLGSFGQWTASDALVLYYDGIIAKGTDVLYPVEDQTSPLGASFVKQYDTSGKLFGTVTAGGSYTFLSGSTFSVELLYNGQGYNDAQANAYYQLRRNANDHFFDTTALAGLSQQTLAQSLYNGSPFLRRYYAMAQYQVREIKNVLDVIVRYTHGLDEHAGQASSIIEWQMTDRIQFFNINTVSVGSREETEFNSILNKSAMVGIEAHF
jgi:hypothetical protein